MEYFQSKTEQETIINFDRAGEGVDLYTSDPVWIRKMDKLVQENPDDFKRIHVETYQGKPIAKKYIFPKRFITIRTRDRQVRLTEGQKKERTERLNGKAGSTDEKIGAIFPVGAGND